jgi:putative oxidoreductase
MAKKNILASFAPQLLSILRVVTGLMFIQHGTNKLFLFPANPGFAGVPYFSLLGLAGVLETIGGPLIILGLYTKPVSFILSGQMAVAYFITHVPRGPWPLLNNGEVTILYCFIFLYFTAVGGGPWSLDRIKRA